MVNYSNAALDATFGALADPTRRAILARLARGETTLQDLAAPYPMSLVAVMKHVRVLERAALVRTQKDGRVRRCRFSPQPLKNAAEWIRFYQTFWEQQFESLDKYLTRTPKEKS